MALFWFLVLLPSVRLLSVMCVGSWNFDACSSGFHFLPLGSRDRRRGSASRRKSRERMEGMTLLSETGRNRETDVNPSPSPSSLEVPISFYHYEYDLVPSSSEDDMRIPAPFPPMQMRSRLEVREDPGAALSCYSHPESFWELARRRAEIRTYWSGANAVSPPSKLGEPMPRQLFVFNLPYYATAADLLQHFKDFQPKSARVFNNSEGTSKGCGCIAFAQEEQAQKALRALQDSVMGGRRLGLKVQQRQANGVEGEDLGDDSSSRGQEGRRGQGGSAGENQQDRRLFMMNIPFDFTEERLLAELRQKKFDPVWVRMFRSPVGVNAGKALLLMKSAADATNLVRYSNTFGLRVRGFRLMVRRDRERALYVQGSRKDSKEKGSDIY
mmetsp:Transcript_5708/g.11330  ORF Transcript_5708/g.11330 Transcript_5708/m.11330 type:complete len:384 (+) Transcript_5708:256-1407(+)